MLLDPSASGPILRQHEEPRDHGRIPAEAFARDPGRKADLRIVATKCLLDRGELGLELDHQQRARRLVPGQQVDGPALAEYRVGDLGLD